MSITHPVHLTCIQIPNIVWCGVNLLIFSARIFSLLEDPDKKWQIHFCAVDHDATLGHVGRVVGTADVAASSDTRVLPLCGGSVLARRERLFLNLCGCFDVFTRRVGRSRGGRRCQKRRGPEGSAGMGMGSDESLSSDVWSVYPCRCLMGRRGGVLAVAPAALRKETTTPSRGWRSC